MEPLPATSAPAAKPRYPLARIIALCVLMLLVGAGVYGAFFTHAGYQLRHHPQHFKDGVRNWTAAHPVIAPLAYFGLYLLMGLCGLPVWWLQVLGGCGFGLIRGIIYSQLSGAIGGTIGVAVSRWLLGDWFHARIEDRVEKLRRIDEAMGHNGFLVVIAVRIMHMIPFALGNYAMGLTRISLIDVFLGSFLGSTPSITGWVTLGAVGKHALRSWQFITAIVVMHIVLLVPLAIRYRRPQVFKRIGVE